MLFSLCKETSSYFFLFDVFILSFESHTHTLCVELLYKVYLIIDIHSLPML